MAEFTKQNLLLLFTTLKQLANADPADKAKIAELQAKLEGFTALEDPEVVAAYNDALAAIAVAEPPPDVPVEPEVPTE